MFWTSAALRTPSSSLAVDPAVPAAGGPTEGVVVRDVELNSAARR